MKNLFTRSLLAAFCSCAAVCAAAAVEFDFQDQNSLKKGIPFSIRGNAKLTSDGLETAGGASSNAALLIDNRYSGTLIPDGGFTLTADFTLDDTANKNYRVIFDNKYIPAPNAKQADYHKGVMLVLRPYGKKFRASAILGFGNASSQVASNDMNIKPGTRYTLEMDFDPRGKVGFYLNGRNCGIVEVPAGKLVHPKRLATFGNRSGSSYWPFNGKLHKITIKPLADRTLPAGAVIAQWDFNKPDTLQDLKLRGKSKIVNGALIAMHSNSLEAAGGAICQNLDLTHTPTGEFEFEAVFSLDSSFKRIKNNPSYIFDNKYVAKPAEKNIRNRGFMVGLEPMPGKDTYRFFAAFGFGSKSSVVYSQKAVIVPAADHTFKLLFDAAGTVNMELDGKSIGIGTVEDGALAPANLTTVLGDRYGSNFAPLGGALKKVVIRQGGKKSAAN